MPRPGGRLNARDRRRQRRDEQQLAAAARERAGRNVPALARWRRWRRALGAALLAIAAPAALRVLAATWRGRVAPGPGRDLLWRGGPALLTLWHGRMLAAMPLRGHRGRSITVLVSPSDDGGLARLALRRFGYRIVRGSLSRGGARALRELAAALADGGPIVLTPDGPRGPRHALNAGVAWLARATGAPIVPVAVAVDRAWRLRSWDRFVIPKPFARLLVVHGDPILAPADATDAQLEEIGDGVRSTILAGERAAFVALGVADDLDGGAPSA
ncbi:MAG: lysophospholipid acyltransferase family protein [Planctomycetota bacterium]